MFPTSSPWERMEWEWEGQCATKQPMRPQLSRGQTAAVAYLWNQRTDTKSHLNRIYWSMVRWGKKGWRLTTRQHHIGNSSPLMSACEVTCGLLWSQPHCRVLASGLRQRLIRWLITLKHVVSHFHYMQRCCFDPLSQLSCFCLKERHSVNWEKKKRSSAALQENKTKTFIRLFTASQNFLLSFLLRRHYETLVKKRNAYNYLYIKKKTHWIKKINPKRQRTFQLCGIQPGTITTADLISKNQHGFRCCSLLRAPGLNLLISAGWGTSSFSSPQSRLSWFSRVILQRLQHTCGTRPFLIGQNANSQKFHHFSASSQLVVHSRASFARKLLSRGCFFLRFNDFQYL